MLVVLVTHLSSYLPGFSLSRLWDVDIQSVIHCFEFSAFEPFQHLVNNKQGVWQNPASQSRVGTHASYANGEIKGGDAT